MKRKIRKGGCVLTNYQEFLYDDIGNSYDRKNLYLKEVAELEAQIAQAASGELKERLKSLKSNKNNHTYILKLNDFLSKEKAFKKALNIESKKYSNDIKDSNSFRVKGLKVALLKSEKHLEFYENYGQLSYDALLKLETAKIKVEQLKEIIETVEEHEQSLKDAKTANKNLNPADEVKVKAELKVFKLEKKKILKEHFNALKQKKKDGLISDKALKNGKQELDKQYKEDVEVKSFESPKKSAKELVGSLRYQLRKGTRRDLNILESNISDLRRKTPIELTRKKPINCFVSLLLPGVGQLLNGQYKKAIFFFVLSFFAYFAALPYTLGFGNYQGEGIAGLISLAAEGGKLDRSLIFMIEGIISIFLILFILAVLFISFKDVQNVEKSKIKGTRARNWFETKTSVFEDGFPYMVSLPALFVIVFIVLVPVTTAILLSFTNLDPNHQNKFEWIGIANYKLIALGEGVAGGPFWLILGWTLIWTLCATSLAIAIGFGLAILSNNERVKGKVFFRSVYLLPWAVPAFITIMFFSIMFSPKGALTEVLNNVIQTDSLIVVKNDPFWSRITLIALQGWLGSAYVFLLSTGVLQAIPADLYEAAQIDGATAWQKLKRITLPIVLFQTAPLLVGQYTFNFNNFSIIYLFNSGGPFEPSKYGNLAGSTDLLISYIFKLTTENDYQAIGAAITIVISMGLMLFAFIGFKNSKAFKEEKL